MNTDVLTPEQILDAAACVLRRFGPRKTTVVDVARELGVSHGTVYRHFATKAALRDAVAERWLQRIAEPLDRIARADEPAEERLVRWLDALVTIKRAKTCEDKEMFAAYAALAEDVRAVVVAYLEEMVAQLAHVLADGMAEGVFAPVDPPSTARALLDATSRFHHPAHHQEWDDPDADAAFARVRTLVLNGLKYRRTVFGDCARAPQPLNP